MSKVTVYRMPTLEELAAELGRWSYGDVKGMANAVLTMFKEPFRDPESAQVTPGELIARERARQIAKGYTAAHDAQHGVHRLLEWSARFAEQGEHIKAAAMVEAARAVIGIGYVPPQTEDEQSEEDREAFDQYDGPAEIDSHDLPDDYDEDAQ